MSGWLHNVCLDKSTGSLKTMARWIRDFVTTHGDYAGDSVVSEKICYDLVNTCAKVTSGQHDEPALVFSYKTRTTTALPSALQRNEQRLNDMAAKHVAAAVDAGLHNGGMGDGLEI